MAEKLTSWDQWKKLSEWVVLFIATLDERVSPGTVLLHFLHWYAMEEMYLSKTYGDTIKISRDERHEIINFVFAKNEDGTNDLNDDIKMIEKMDPNLFPPTPRSVFVTDQFRNSFRNTKEYKHLFWDK